MEQDDNRLKHWSSEAHFTGMKTYKQEERDRMPWIGDHIDLAEGHQGIKQFYYGSQGDWRNKYNEALQNDREVAISETGHFNNVFSNDIH